MMEAQSILFSTAQLAMEVVEKEVRIESRAIHTFFSGGEGRGIKKSNSACTSFSPEEIVSPASV